MFIGVHLTINLLLIVDNSGELFNQGAEFMATNPLIKIMEPILGLGFMIHIIWSFYLEYKNWKARPVKYAAKKYGSIQFVGIAQYACFGSTGTCISCDAHH